MRTLYLENSTVYLKRIELYVTMYYQHLTDILSQELQSETLDILSLFPKVEALIHCLYSKRNEETFNQIWNETEELWEKCISRGYSVARLFPNKKRKVLKNLTMAMVRWAHHLFHLPKKNITKLIFIIETWMK
uniref:Uncharacterized protein n=1 Tax=Timema genevievae TaxID=629358 RepID=A0A7R9JZP8_TIMGE|nr:unnamed protein product [Timema genevievae]